MLFPRRQALLRRPANYSELLPFLDELCSPEKATLFMDNLEVAWQKRPLTLVHGDGQMHVHFLNY